MAATPITPVKVPGPIKEHAKARAAAEGRTLTDVVVALLDRYGKGEIDA